MDNSPPSGSQLQSTDEKQETSMVTGTSTIKEENETVSTDSEMSTAEENNKETSNDDSENAAEEEETAQSEACKNKIRVMEYLKRIYGKKTLAGQHMSKDLLEIDAIRSVTGKEPALIEYDFMDCSPSRVERGAEGIDLKRFIKWWDGGGLVAFCWHWNAPMGLIDEEPDKQWWRGFYTEATTFNFANGIRDPESIEHELLIRDIDAIAAELKKLQDAGVPVIWRPLHEASGGWFWWGSQGPEPYIKLWRMMYERLTEYHHLDNLIWVWNGEAPDWYPGDDVVDIVGIDYYGAKHDYSPREKEFKAAEEYADTYKMVALTETGVVPDPDLMKKTGTKWLWYSVWSEVCVLAKDNSYSEKYTEAWMLKKVYNHEAVITKDELPLFKQ